MEKKSENLLDEQVKKILYRSSYLISETPKYKPIIEDNVEFDDLPPEVLHSTQDGFPEPNAGGGTNAYLEEVEVEDELPPEELGPTEPVAEPTNAVAPNQDDVPELPAEELPAEEPMDVPAEELPAEEIPVEEPVPEENPAQEVNQIQNEIIRHNLEAMRDVTSKLGALESMNAQLSTQLDVLNAKVVEVEEPTNAEQLMSKKDVSYPYYFNLNDFWKNNWFDQQRAEAPQEKGIRELPDGSFIADFDDLPTHSDIDLDDSLNSIV